jgi:hypothetical protein
MMKTMMQAVSLFCCWTAALLAGGCGYKTMPVAPQASTPRPVTDLTCQLTGTGAVLRWTYPKETVTGEDLQQIDSFQLYRAELPESDYCETCPIPFGKPISLPGGILPDKGRRQGSWETDSLRPGRMYFFMLRSKSGWLADSGDSNIVSFTWAAPPAAPGGLTAEAGDGQISLRWQPVTTRFDGSPLRSPVKYQLARSADGGSFANIGGQLVTPYYTDKEVRNGRKYAYRVQALAGAAGGGYSLTVEAGAVDRTPPEPPRNVKAVRTASSVKVYWDRSEEKDVAGHHVYRRLGEGGPELLGKVMEPYNLFEDKNPPAKGGKAWYSVSSFDLSSPPNESQRSDEASLR